eukprot:m.217533 g.217533  ORF g.217533 m.217533 type:complete len:181 (+) comp33236_c0_seq19:228-770(+)
MLALSGDNECMAQPCDVTGTYKSGSAYDCNSRGYTTFPTTTWGNDTTRIWLNSNHITLIPDNAFGELYSLVQLHLDRNKIKAIPRHTFDSLSALLFLSLAVNEITALPDQVFDGVREIQTLDLSNNQITAFPTNVFDGLTQDIDRQRHLVFCHVCADVTTCNLLVLYKDVHPNTTSQGRV